MLSVKEIQKYLYQTVGPLIESHGFKAVKKNTLDWRKDIGWCCQMITIPVSKMSSGYITMEVVPGFYDPIVHASRLPGKDFEHSVTYGTLLRRLKNPGIKDWTGRKFGSIHDVHRETPSIIGDIDEYVWGYFSRYPSRRSIIDVIERDGCPGDFENKLNDPYLLFYLRGVEEDPGLVLVEAERWRADREAKAIKDKDVIRPALFVQIDMVIEFLRGRIQGFGDSHGGAGV